jgi:hypothetical protein
MHFISLSINSANPQSHTHTTPPATAPATARPEKIQLPIVEQNFHRHAVQCPAARALHGRAPAPRRTQPPARTPRRPAADSLRFATSQLMKHIVFHTMPAASGDPVPASWQLLQQAGTGHGRPDLAPGR